MSTAEAKVLESRALTGYQDYSPERKAEVIALVDANNGNVKQTALDTGIAHQTIRYWLTQADRYSQFQNAKRGDLGDKMEFLAHNLADSIAEHDLSIVSLAHKATAMGIVIDKMQLLRGLPTAISGSAQTDEERNTAKQALFAAIEARAIEGETATLEAVSETEYAEIVHKMPEITGGDPETA